MRVIVSRRASEQQAASTNSVSRFETELLTHPENLPALSRLKEAWVSRAMGRTKTRRLILDLDSSESPVHGKQEGACYNGHFECMRYHPLFCFSQFGDCEGAMLRPGHVHSAHDWKELLEPVAARYGDSGLRKYLRADAAFAGPQYTSTWSRRGSSMPFACRPTKCGWPSSCWPTTWATS